MSRWTVAAALVLVLAVKAQNQEPFELVVVQYNPPANPAEREYYMDRVRSAVELAEGRGQGNVLLLNTGGAVLTEDDLAASSAVSPAATALSLSDFDMGLTSDGGLISKLKASGEKFVAANLQSPQLGDLVSKSVVTTFGDRSVGVVGFVSPYLNVLLNEDDDSHIGSEVMAVRAEVANLKNQGANIIIAMGNAGHAANKELAGIVPGVDVVVSAPTEVVGADFPQMVSRPGRDIDVPMLEIPTRTGNTIAVTRFLFNAKGQMKRGVGMYAVVQEGVADDLEKDIIDILRLQPERNEVTGHNAVDNDIESEAPAAHGPAAPEFRPRPAVATASGELLSTADGVISGLHSDCASQECAMGKVIADAIKWKLGGRINVAMVGSRVFSGSWQGEIRESDVDDSIADGVAVYMGRVHGAAELMQLFMQSTMTDSEFMHPSGVTMNQDPSTHVISNLMVECSMCVPAGLRPVHSDMPYTISFATEADTQPSVIKDVQDTGMSLKNDIVIPYLRRNRKLMVPSDSRITTAVAGTNTVSRVSQVLTAAEPQDGAATPNRAPVVSPNRAPVVPPNRAPTTLITQTPTVQAAAPHASSSAAAAVAGDQTMSAEHMMQHLPPPPSNSADDMLAHQQATAAYQQAVLTAIRQAATGQTSQQYTSEEQATLTSLYNSMTGGTTANGVVVRRPAVTTVGQQGVPASLLGGSGQVYAQPEAQGPNSQLPSLLQAITGQQTQQDQSAGTDGVSSLLPSWLTSSSADSAGAADGTEDSGLSSYLPSWLGGEQDDAAAAPASAWAGPGQAAADPEDSGSSVTSQVLRFAIGVPSAVLLTSLGLGAIL